MLSKASGFKNAAFFKKLGSREELTKLIDQFQANKTFEPGIS